MQKKSYDKLSYGCAVAIGISVACLSHNQTSVEKMLVPKCYDVSQGMILESAVADARKQHEYNAQRLRACENSLLLKLERSVSDGFARERYSEIRQYKEWTAESFENYLLKNREFYSFLSDNQRYWEHRAQVKSLEKRRYDSDHAAVYTFAVAVPILGLAILRAKAQNLK